MTLTFGPEQPKTWRDRGLLGFIKRKLAMRAMKRWAKRLDPKMNEIAGQLAKSNEILMDTLNHPEDRC